MSSRPLLQRIGGTPLVPLAKLSDGLPVPVLAKCEHLNPGGSVKDRIAAAIVDAAERDGRLRPGMTIVEATAGNTGIGLCLVAAVRGYRVACVLPEKMAIEKRRLLAQLGAEVIITKNAPPDDPANFQVVARRLAHERGWFLADQFANPANPAVHEATTGPEIWADTAGTVGAFVAGAGTGGTISGVGRALKQRNPGVRIVLADPVGSRLADWIRTRTLGAEAPYAVEGIGSSRPPPNLDAEVIDAVEVVSDDESFATCRRLVQEEGLLVGGSSGTVVAAALRVAKSGRVSGPVVALLGDSWDRYHGTAWMLSWM